MYVIASRAQKPFGLTSNPPKQPKKSKKAVNDAYIELYKKLLIKAHSNKLNQMKLNQ